MPATSERQITKQDTQKPRASAPTKKRRVIRRRGRARGELDSDDEIEREPATDESDSDDDSDSLDSATDDSETEPVSEEAIPHDRAHLPTPRNSKSPDSVGKGVVSPFFAPTGSWSEMVMDETVNGPAELPVVDFADFSAPLLPKSKNPIRKPKKSPNFNSLPESRATPAEPVEQPLTPPPADPELTTAAATETNRNPHRRKMLPGHSARQVYQQKLDSDPSFVPTIGNFWSHDDRLIETELRNLSGWWRGRGGRGRREGGREYNTRGRGGFSGRDNWNIEEEEEVPPVDRPWTHDGFEELRKKDDQRRVEQAAVRQAQSSPKRGGFAGRGRGNFMQGRGRGGHTRGFSSPARSRNNSPYTSGNRVRFAMKPELMWTKQHEAFLYFDASLKPRPGQVPVFRVRLPGQQLHVIRVSSSVAVASEFPSKTTRAGLQDNYVVRLPNAVQAEQDTDEHRDDETSKDTSIVNQSLSAKAGPGPNSLATDSTPSVPQEVVESNDSPQAETVTLEPTPLEQHSPPPLDVGANDPPVTSPVHERPVLPPLQTTFTPPPLPPPQPVSQPSPAYGSPFGYALSLPPGIAMSAHGMPYELATGRPVYLQPPTMYNPRPIIHSHYLHPGHMHHSLSNATPDFLAHPASHTPPINGFIDPATGTPIFSFPRQTSRIEIRAPGETPSPAAPKLTPKAPSPPLTSSLRPNSASFQPARLNAESSDSSGYYLPSSTPSDTTLPSYEPQGTASMEDPAAPSSMMEHYYPQQYYYPEPYGYSQYMDMSHAGQTYHMYGMEQAPQGTVYY